MLSEKERLTNTTVPNKKSAKKYMRVTEKKTAKTETKAVIKNEKSGNEDREHIKEHFSHSLYDAYKPNDYKRMFNYRL